MKLNESIMRNLKEADLPTWCGIPGTIYRYHGDWSDPEVEAGMCLYNEWDLQDMITGGYAEDDPEYDMELEDIVKQDPMNALYIISETTPTGVGVTFEMALDKAHNFEELRKILEGMKKDREHCFIPEKVLDMAIEHANIEDNDDYVDTMERMEEIVPEIIEIVDEAVKSGKYMMESAVADEAKDSKVIKVKCYNDTKTYKSRQEAIEFYTDGIYCSEGHEQARYIYIVKALKNGANYVDADNMGNDDPYLNESISSNGKYDTIYKCTLTHSIGGTYDNCFVLSYEGCSPEFEIELTGNCYFQTEYYVENKEVIANVSSVEDVKKFIKARGIKITDPDVVFPSDGTMVVGGERDRLLGQDLTDLGWIESLEESFLVEAKAEPYILSEDEYGALDKVMDRAHLSDEFMLGNYGKRYNQEKNGDSFYDFETGKRISLSKGLGWVAEAFTSPEAYDLSDDEYKALQRLMKKFGYNI